MTRVAALTLAVVGAGFPNKSGPDRRFEIAMCKRGEPVELRAEPNNPADHRAIAVYSARGIQIGYAPAERAARIGQLINQGHDIVAIFQDHADFGAFIRVGFDGQVPTLPQRMRKAEPEPDFWPDPVWDDE